MSYFRNIVCILKDMINWATTCDLQQCGSLTSVLPPVKLRSSKLCSVSSLTLSLPTTSKTNTSVPSMFQKTTEYWGCKVSPEPFDLLLWNLHRMLLIHKTFIWTNNNEIVTWPLLVILEAILKYGKMPINNYFMHKKIKHPSTPSIKHNNFIRYYIV